MQDPQLKKRILTAAVLIALLVAIVVLASQSCLGRWLLAGLAIVINGFCAFEFARLATHSLNARNKIRVGAIYLILAFLPSLYALLNFTKFDFCLANSLIMKTLALEIFAVSVFSLLGAIAYIIHSGRRSLEEASAIGCELLTGIIIVAMGGAAFLSLAIQSDAYRLILWLLLVVCLNDTCAYFTGKKIGGPKLSPMISPNKTWSGSLGGIIGGVISGLFFSFLLGSAFSWTEMSVMTLLVCLVSQLGDLAKSYIKRIHGVKDTGTLLPGHGGILDRVDGVITGSIVLYFFVILKSF